HVHPYVERLRDAERQPVDVWMHVAGTPGSHVVVRNPDKLDPLPRPVLQRAAALAVKHSKAKNARGKVHVHVCRACDVTKRRGAPAGQVQLKRYDVLKVYAAD
ncbi:MAG: NFACT RNA binding domain-containing protein, partial [Bacteroidota bacterium]